MPKIKILYIDDEDINLRLFKINLEKKYQIFTAQNGVQGLEILAQESDIQIVVSDMRMPYMNGEEFISKAKEIYPNIVYYILSGFDITDKIQEFIEKGTIKKHFRKPFNLKEIGLELEKAVSH
ncbi:response regulator [Saccharicrinis fermentans]|uniref:Sporulation initiation phosphotransferase F n=1 Tax=Saccharicrinis fermentans DSM 9555 = JCM 21142 TaxID=869213 RepID=W7Y7R5_9BACT|nr:response regulator [Saccharicrinis fermentans]GAF04282.1 sporulation initiation phosphotransferase F [Saccharicrinis fermentans DSM 9555 = JCM 21142]